MEKKLPEVEIEGTTFQFDIDQLALIEKGNPDNEIYFGYMRDEGTHYSFNYSPSSNNHSFVKTESEFFDLLDGIKKPGTVIPVKIPRIGEIDPEGMCRKYGCSLQDIEHKSDFEIMVNQDEYNRRLNGEPVTIDLAGNLYEVDLKANALRPKDNTGEVIYLNEYHYDFYLEDEQVYNLFFNISENRVADIICDGSRDRTEDRIILEVPHPYVLDPIGGNLHLGFNPKAGLMFFDELKMHHTAEQVPWDLYNIEVGKGVDMTSENAYDLRVNKGMLPTIAVAGHTFYVDIRMDKLRPKDDFLSNGIVLSDIEKYYDSEDGSYTIPYNPEKHEFREPDYKNIKELPKDLVAVQFPSERILDPIGWNRKYGMEITHGVNKSDFKMHFTAKNVPWEKTFLAELIRRNPDSDRKLKNGEEKQQRTGSKQSKSRGRRM